MADVRIFFRDGPMPFPGDEPPIPLAEAAAVTVDSVRLAWTVDRLALLAVAAVAGGAAAAELGQLLSSRNVLDAVLGGQELRSQGRRLLVLGGLSLATAASQSTNQVLQGRISSAVSRQAERKVLELVGGMELADVEDPAFQDRLHRATMGAGQQGDLLRRALAMPPAAAGLAAAIAAMGDSDRAIVPLAFGGAVIQWLLVGRAPDPRRQFGFRSREGREAGVLRHYLTGAQAAHEVRAFDASRFLLGRFDEIVERAAQAEKEVARRNWRRGIVSSLAGRAAAGPAAARLVASVAGRQRSVADAVAGGLAAKRLNGGFQRIVQSMAGLRRTAGIVRDYRDFVVSPPASSGGPGPERDFGRIVLDEVSFTYRGGRAPVLDGVNLEIRRGEVVALVGENGCGKTTLAKLLCCLYRPTKGTIRWDGVDTAWCDAAAVRANIAVVFQDFVRYPSLTAAENIGIGLPSRLHDRAAIVDAARRAGADEIISALPKGYDTVLARPFGGVDLSIGQWQRVALARAFLRDAPLVVLDEPTAALDPRAERDLFEAVASLYRRRSALLISHRLSSVRFADRICVLAGGRITETGTHDELLAADGVYAELFDLQARAYR